MPTAKRLSSTGLYPEGRHRLERSQCARGPSGYNLLHVRPRFSLRTPKQTSCVPVSVPSLFPSRSPPSQGGKRVRLIFPPCAGRGAQREGFRQNWLPLPRERAGVRGGIRQHRRSIRMAESRRKTMAGATGVMPPTGPVPFGRGRQVSSRPAVAPTLTPALCIDRGHGGRAFGDMGNTFSLW